MILYSKDLYQMICIKGVMKNLTKAAISTVQKGGRRELEL